MFESASEQTGDARLTFGFLPRLSTKKESGKDFEGMWGGGGPGGAATRSLSHRSSGQVRPLQCGANV